MVLENDNWTPSKHRNMFKYRNVRAHGLNSLNFLLRYVLDAYI